MGFKSESNLDLTSRWWRVDRRRWQQRDVDDHNRAHRDRKGGSMAVEPDASHKEVDREVARIERLFNRGMLVVGFLATLAFAGGALSFSTLNENVSKTAEQARINIKELADGAQRSVEKQLAEVKDKIVNETMNRLKIDDLETDIRTRAIDQVKLDLKNALQEQLDQVVPKVAELDDHVKTLSIGVGNLKEKYNEILILSNQI
jgi:hypothetical protein